ncbi:unnamed protein product [Linum trigynum]|uniref:Uncharacterized protein n=1 Tax=Linum trigynum TaxID=586398 RepID=A0AAV2EIJ3_9ROSI
MKLEVKESRQVSTKVSLGVLKERLAKQTQQRPSPEKMQKRLSSSHHLLRGAHDRHSPPSLNLKNTTISLTSVKAEVSATKIDSENPTPDFLCRTTIWETFSNV